jgi:hypothetical protein
MKFDLDITNSLASLVNKGGSIHIIINLSQRVVPLQG